jgi:hypothetical protein
MQFYDYSPLKALKSIYGEIEWNPIELATVPMGYWNDVSNQLNFVKSLGK